MLVFTLAQMRRNLGRLIAAGIAIIIGTAFVAATLLSASLIERASADALTSRHADADLVLTGDLSLEAMAAIAAVDGVQASHASISTYVELSGGGRSLLLPAMSTAQTPRLQAATLTEGALPAPGEVILPVGVADQLDLTLGDEVVLTRQTWVSSGTSDPELDTMMEGEWTNAAERLRLVGLFEDPGGIFTMTGGAAMLHTEQAQAWAVDASTFDSPEQVPVDAALVLLAPDADVEAVRADLLAATDHRPAVRTLDEVAKDATAELTGESNVLTVLGLGAASIALIVAGLVISNTFQVLVAQRTRSLALLRCIGASARQLRRSVTIEALLVGIGASLGGIAVGSALVQIALMILGRTPGGASLPATIAITPAVVLVPVIAGTVVAWFASIAPARAASRVAPLEAMRPSEGPATGRRASRTRLVFAMLLLLGGAALLAVGMLAGTHLDIMLGVLVGILGGLLSFVGVLIGAVFWIPRAIAATSRLVTRPSRPATTLAVSNSLRNPRRTAATSSALLSGVTLVAMMSTGASTAQAGFAQELDRAYPVDIAIESFGDPGEATASPAALPWQAEVDALEGVERSALVAATPLQLRYPDGDHRHEGLVADASDVVEVVRDPDTFAPMEGQTMLLPHYMRETSGLRPGDTIEVTALDETYSSTVGATLSLTVQYADLGNSPLISAAVARQLGAQLTPSALWLRSPEHIDPVLFASDLQELLQEHSVGVISAAAEREMFEEIISTLLAVAIGLLAVAVVIALVGVANTLSLSVIERRRESATLRAIGLTRRQLRQTLAIESLWIAGAGAVLGIILGTIYGYVGTRTLLGSMTEGIPLSVPWGQLGVMIVASLLAGMAASLLPGRRAAHSSPVEALAAP